jgi:sigma-B regulation protein RsbU (phosphoserine phosphatase)
VGGSPGQDAFTFSVLSIPFVIVVLGMAAIGLLVLLIRGNGIIRASVLAILVLSLPWAVGSALSASANHPATVARLARFYFAPLALLGPVLMVMMFAITGLVEKYRLLVAVATVVALVSCVVTWTTDLVIAGAWQTPWGLWYPRAGPLHDFQLGQFMFWAVIGVWLSRRGSPVLTSERQKLHARRVGIALVLVALCAADSLLARGIGAYPFSVVPIVVVCGLAVIGIVKHDLLQARGFDRAGAYEIALVLVLSAVILAALALLWLQSISSPVISALVIVPILFAGQLGAFAIRGRMRGERVHVAEEADTSLEEFVEWTAHVRDESKLRARLEKILATYTGLSRVRLLARDPSAGYLPIGGDAGPVALDVDVRVRAWLTANSAPLVGADLPTMHLGGLREPIEGFMRHFDAEVVVPLVDRAQLVGVIAAAAPADRALRDAEVEILRQSGSATARALTYLSLFHEAQARSEVAREVEVAAAVQYARAAGEQRASYGDCEVVSYYQPAVNFGGHWSGHYELEDGRLVIVIGDVAGQGVSAALVSFTVEGACETAQRMLGADLEVVGLLELLNRSLSDVGDQQYSMSCFAALFDIDGGEVSYASAGHPFPYLCRRVAGANGKGDKLRALVSRGTPLGGADVVLNANSMALEPDDVVVLHSDSVVELRNADGVAYGDRRLQRLLRKRARSAGAGACQLILDEVMHYHGDRPLEDDINLIVVHLPSSAAQPS